MGDSCVETSEAPAWLLKLEKQREKLSQARLGHDSGAGAPCNSCGTKCPGLDLHFWRKVCRACQCSKDVHDIQDDDLSGWAQFQLLGTARPKKATLSTVKIKGIADEPVKVDWVPPNAPPELVAEYMVSLGALAPVTGSEAARRRRTNLRTQLPPHDAAPSHAAHASPAERADHEEYLARVRSAAAGRGHVVRVGSLLRLVPGLALRPAGRAPPDPPRAAPPAAAALGLGPARLRSALAHPDLYDRVFAALAALGLDAGADEGLRPVLRLRAELRRRPGLRAALPPAPPAAADEGVIFGLGGEMWAWRRDAAGDVRSSRVSPQFVTSSAAPPPQAPLRSEPLRRAPAADEPPPPPPNYDTYPIANSDCVAGEAAELLAELELGEPGAAEEEEEAEAGGSAVAPFAGMSASEAAEFDRRLHAEGVPCRRCGGAMFAGEVAVAAARAGAGAVWHPACFSCRSCGELLADLVYFYLRGEVYCARHLAAALDVPRCAGCDELIFARPYTAAEGRAYHVQHFCCVSCDCALGGAQYVPGAAGPQCVACAERAAERCGACGGAIGPEQQGVSLAAAHWHAACFVCAGRACARSLLSGQFVLRDALPYCSAKCVRSRGP